MRVCFFLKTDGMRVKTIIPGKGRGDKHNILTFLSKS